MRFPPQIPPWEKRYLQADFGEPLVPVLARATYPARSGRYPSVKSFLVALSEKVAAW